MRKLKLSLDALQVESFHATKEEALRGTVPAHGLSEVYFESCFGTCDNNCTQYYSCGGGCPTAISCDGTCHYTCDCPPPTGYSECGCQTWETCPDATICA